MWIHPYIIASRFRIHLDTLCLNFGYIAQCINTSCMSRYICKVLYLTDTSRKVISWYILYVPIHCKVMYPIDVSRKMIHPTDTSHNIIYTTKVWTFVIFSIKKKEVKKYNEIIFFQNLILVISPKHPRNNQKFKLAHDFRK